MTVFRDAVKFLDLDSKKLVEVSQDHMFVFHLPSRVLDGMNRAAEEPRGSRWELREVLMPCQCHVYQLVEEDTLDCP